LSLANAKRQKFDRRRAALLSQLAPTATDQYNLKLERWRPNVFCLPRQAMFRPNTTEEHFEMLTISVIRLSNLYLTPHDSQHALLDPHKPQSN